MTISDHLHITGRAGYFTECPPFRKAGCQFAACLAALTLTAVLPRAALSANWPQWRFDANRSGATEESCPDQPSNLWSLSLPYPDPAYDHQYRMCADITYAPIAAEGMLFIPSNVTGRVLAYDLQTGKARWHFATEGPVRFAPVYRDGNVYFGSDDGYLYCVSAAEGKLRWKTRGAPETHPDSRMLINGKICSRWPVRGAPVSHGNAVFFGAGIWPEEGVYVCAADAKTGKILWRSDSMSMVKDGMSDHGRAYDHSLPPQGYTAVIDGQLAVPSGRSLAAWFDTVSGRMEPYTCFYAKLSPPRGTWFVSGIAKYCVQGGNWFGTTPDALPPKPPELEDSKPAIFWSKSQPENELHVVKNRPFFNADTYRLHNENLYTEPVLTAEALYASEFAEASSYLVPRGHTHISFPKYDRIVARDLKRPEWKSTVVKHTLYGKRKTKMPRLEFPVLWELDSPLRILIKGGNRLYAGGEDTIAAVEIPRTGEKPRIAWEKKITGTPVNALIADRKLVVATHDGNVLCFGAEPTPKPSPAPGPPKTQPQPQNRYACVLGWGNGSRALSLAQDNFRTIVIEPDAEKAKAARDQVTETSLYQRKIQVIEGRPADMQFTPYWASLVIAESPDAVGRPETVFPLALDILRPYSGRLLIPRGQKYLPTLKRLLEDRTGYNLETEGQNVTVYRESPPDGTDDWTHEAGGADNCFANSDSRVKWPLETLWYSGTIDRYFTPASHFQHERHPFPLVSDGRMFIITGHRVHAVDIYTGCYLWKTELPPTPWMNTRKMDSRIYGRPTERNCVAAKDLLYVITGEKIHALDTATGKKIKVLKIPEELRDSVQRNLPPPAEQRFHGQTGLIQAVPAWTEVRLRGNLLVTMLGNTLTAVDRHSGDIQWTRKSTMATTTYAAGRDILVCLDCEIPEMGGSSRSTKMNGLLWTADPETGEVLWQKTVQYEPVPRHNISHPRPWLRPVIPNLALNEKHGLIILTVNRNSIHAFDSDNGKETWSRPLPAAGDIQRIYPPVVTDDYLLLSRHNGYFGFLLDIQTGREAGEDTGIIRPRTCARVIGNNNLLVYRDAATELYDIPNNRMVRFNSIRSGCTTSFIPAEGIMTAPMLGHGCVCNYPMFASLALYHSDSIEECRPAIVTDTWKNELEADASTTDRPSFDRGGPEIDLEEFRLFNATLRATGSAVVLSTKNDKAGYAIRESDRHLDRVKFTITGKRAVTGERRHGNATFVFGEGGEPGNMIQCKLYYGGRQAMTITGAPVKHAEKEVTCRGGEPFRMTVTVDCAKQTVVFEAAGAKLTVPITRQMNTVTHYGWGGNNSDNLFARITVD